MDTDAQRLLKLKLAIATQIGLMRCEAERLRERGGNALTSSALFDYANELERIMEHNADNCEGSHEVG